MTVNQLLNLLNDCSDYGLSPSGGAWVRFSDFATADKITTAYYQDFLLTARKLSSAIQIFYGEESFKIQPWMQTEEEMTETIITQASNTLWFSPGLQIDIELLQLAQDLLENPRAAGVVNLKTERQVILHNQLACTLTSSTMENAATWTRGQFWDPQDLLDFRRYTRQEMSPGTTKEFTYRTFEPTLGPFDNSPGNWLQQVTRYRIQGDYQLCENLDFKEIEAPAF